MRDLMMAAAFADHPWVAGMVLCGLTGVAAAVLVGQRRDAAARGRRAPARPGDPHYDPHASSPTPPGPATCAACRTPLPDRARFCPACGAAAAGAGSPLAVVPGWAGRPPGPARPRPGPGWTAEGVRRALTDEPWKGMGGPFSAADADLYLRACGPAAPAAGGGSPGYPELLARMDAWLAANGPPR
jgi:hypothetical protein